MLLARYERKSFLHRTVAGDDKWIFFENPKRKKSWVDSGQPSTSTVRPNRFGKERMICVWLNQEGVIYQQQFIDLNRALLKKRPQYKKRQQKLILLHDIRQNRFARRWKYSAGKCQPIRLTHKTWHLRTTICFHRWVTRLRTSTSKQPRRSNNGSMNGFPPNHRNFLERNPQIGREVE